MIDRPTRRVTPIERVVRTKGTEQQALATCLDPDHVVAGGNLVASCIEARADLLVTSRFGSYDLTCVAVPHGFDPEATGHVVAAVGTGPHSSLAAEVAYRIGTSLGRPVEFVSAARPEDTERAGAVLTKFTRRRPLASWRVIDSADPRNLVAALPADALIVVGAPGGNWFERQLFGAGARLRVKAPAGAVVVRSAPRRVFHEAAPPSSWVSPHLPLDALPGVMEHDVEPVVDDGKLVGIVRKSSLGRAGGATVGDAMEAAPTISLDDPLAEAEELASFFEGSPIPVVDGDGRFVAVLDLDV